MPTYKTPDVYVEEISTFPPSVAEVGTAIPAFIGYTQKAARLNDGDLILKPTKIYSLNEYENWYGFPNADGITVNVTKDVAGAYQVTSVVVNDLDLNTATEPAPSYLLYYAVKMFFDNGGRECYIVSVGPYLESLAVEWVGTSGNHGLKNGLAAVALEDEPTLIVIPEAVKLDLDGEEEGDGEGPYSPLVQAVLLQCDKLRDRFAIFDLHDGSEPLDADELLDNRESFGNNFLKYGAAYYPFVRTTMNPYVTEDEAASNVAVTGIAPEDLPEEAGEGEGEGEGEEEGEEEGEGEEETGVDLASLKSGNTVLYNLVKAALKSYFVIMPPSAAVAGVYAATDGARGVWKAPANVSLAGVIEPVVKLDSKAQEDFNVDATTGKSINALRAFAGKGTLVWGARTLAGNDNEWRYIPVRRFFNMVEESVKKSTYWAVFEPNDANTWVKVRGMIENYLTDKWREGALAGATPKDAFFVKCGLGSTMTAQDILEGRLNVEIGMAVVRPAEFIILKFSHKLQTS